MKRVSTARRILVTGLLAMMLPATTLAHQAPDPERMMQQPVPEHDDAATYRGKTALEHAELLMADAFTQRLMGLERIGAMGVDGLPARDLVRRVFRQDGSDEMTARQADQLRLAALNTLYMIRAPEAEALLRQAILDPGFSDNPRTQRELMLGAVAAGLDEQTLSQDLLALADSKPEHASRLMVTDALPDSVLSPLAEALFHTEHDEDATRFFLARMDDLEFVDDATWLDYVREHADLATQNRAEVQAALAQIGTQDALELALAIDESPAQRGELFDRFARGPLGPEPVFRRLLAALRDEITQQETAHLANRMEQLARELATGAAGFGSSAQAEPALTGFSDAMADLIAQGPSDDHRLIGIQRLVRFQQRHPQTPPSTTLGPVFDVLEQPDTSELVRQQATSTLQRSPARLVESDPGYVIERAVALLWKAESPSDAELPEQLLGTPMRSAEHAPQVVDTILESIDDHRDRWAINPAVGVLMSSGLTRGLERSASREQASMEMGRILVNPEADFAHIGDHFLRNRGGGALANLEHNSVAGIIGILEPVIFDTGSGWQAPFPPEVLADLMTARPGWLSRDSQAQTEWIEFLARVRDQGDPDFSPVAEAALDEF
ncbi:hypothetical protein [Halomonas urumqiensis]|uniref:HEAT repeat domain-containing protein n=1 Tax=Halomonas urumqiensis TaxID=1684789 RepID=A0A2N7UGR1_9GAMM|nr:hypothetical protein [Halomonas urumqiensis]PMR79658.1 hypothetical protein C1H70_11150 [Halomonas urumqiensis]PTB03112.1 hypothetical protein C6V82_00930 [Halomonas urumqiensis]GHE20747.1 hypothetical protein GCM10017767_12680 [Halomonas urumqiensis]